MFNDAAGRYKAAFPAILKSLVISLGAETVYVSPEVAAQLSANVQGVKAMLAKRNKWMHDNNAVAAAGIGVFAPGLGVRYVSFDLDKVPSNYVSRKLPSRLNFITLLDHEIGHLVVEKASTTVPGLPVHVMECAADAYASLRHFQRFGGHTDFAEHAPGSMALEATLYHSKHHYTSATIEAVIALYRQSPAKIKSLSLKETAELAGELAFAHALKPQVLNKVETAFAPARKAWLEQPRDWAKVAAALVEVVRSHPDDTNIRTAGILSVKRADIWHYVPEADKAFISPPPAAKQPSVQS